ncbi:MAG: hypothetical protein J6U54_08515 [Clostridiales bacterium]|nr:hypothetical protein [Clostridiales bacterium]
MDKSKFKDLFDKEKHPEIKNFMKNYSSLMCIGAALTIGGLAMIASKRDFENGDTKDVEKTFRKYASTVTKRYSEPEPKVRKYRSIFVDADEWMPISTTSKIMDAYTESLSSDQY